LQDFSARGSKEGIAVMGNAEIIVLVFLFSCFSLLLGHRWGLKETEKDLERFGEHHKKMMKLWENEFFKVCDEHSELVKKHRDLEIQYNVLEEIVKSKE
jgi:hypothetical protein